MARVVLLAISLFILPVVASCANDDPPDGSPCLMPVIHPGDPTAGVIRGGECFPAPPASKDAA